MHSVSTELHKLRAGPFRQESWCCLQPAVFPFTPPQHGEELTLSAQLTTYHVGDQLYHTISHQRPSPKLYLEWCQNLLKSSQTKQQRGRRMDKRHGRDLRPILPPWWGKFTPGYCTIIPYASRLSSFLLPSKADVRPTRLGFLDRFHR